MMYMYVSGYSTVLEVPDGARNIYIRDLGENRNPLGNRVSHISLNEYIDNHLCSDFM